MPGDWLKDTSCCPKCGKNTNQHKDSGEEDEKKCKYGKGKEAGPLDRGITPVSKHGNFSVGKYKFWVTSATWGKHEDLSSDYLFVYLTREDKGYHFYVNIPKFHNYMELDRRNMPTDVTDMNEYRWYEHVKDYQMPMFKMTSKHLDELILKCLRA